MGKKVLSVEIPADHPGIKNGRIALWTFETWVEFDNVQVTRLVPCSESSASMRLIGKGFFRAHRKLGWPDVFTEAVKTVVTGLITANEPNVCLLGNFHLQSPIDAVDQQAAEVLVEQIGGGPHRGAEYPIGVPRFILVVT